MKKLAMKTTMAIAGVLLASAAIAFGLGFRQASTILVCVGMLVIVQAVLVVDNAVLIRESRLGNLAIRNGTSGVAAAICQILAIVADYNTAIGLSAAIVIGRLVAVGFTYHKSAREEVRFVGKLDYSARRAMAAVTSGIVSNSSSQVLMFTIFSIFGPAAGAQVSVAQRVAGTPVTVMGQALAQISIASLAPIVRSGDQKKSVEWLRLTLCKLLLFSLVTCSVLVVVAVFFLNTILGPGWKDAADVLLLLAIPLSLQLVALPIMPVYNLTKNETLGMKIQCGRLALQIIATTSAGLISQSFLITAAVTSVVWSASYLALIRGTFWSVRNPGVVRDPSTLDESRGLLIHTQSVRTPSRPDAAWHSNTWQREVKRSNSTMQTVIPTQPRSRDIGIKWLVLTASASVAIFLAIYGRYVLPEKYYYDDSTIRDYLQGRDPSGDSLSYRATAEFYRWLGLGDAPTLAALLAVVIFILATYLALTRDVAREPGWPAISVAAVSTVLCGVYLAKFSKEFIVLALVLAFIFAVHRGRLAQAVWIVLALLYAVFVREYWILILAITILSIAISVKMTSIRRIVAYVFTLAIVLSICFRFILGVTPQYFRYTINDGLIVDRATVIVDPINSGSVVLQSINIILILLSLLVPIPLFFAGSAVHAVSSVLIFSFWVVVLRKAKTYWSFAGRLSDGVPPEILRCTCLLFAYVFTQSFFEPDYGSYLRHLIPLAPVAVYFLCGPRVRYFSSLNAERVGVRK